MSDSASYQLLLMPADSSDAAGVAFACAAPALSLAIHAVAPVLDVGGCSNTGWGMRSGITCAVIAEPSSQVAGRVAGGVAAWRVTRKRKSLPPADIDRPSLAKRSLAFHLLLGCV